MLHTGLSRSDLMLAVSSLTKYFGTHLVVEGVSFVVRPSEIVCMLGENGAGKSTIMKMIAGVMGADSGDVEINGDKMGIHSYSLKKNLGFLPEGVPLYDEMLVADYLRYMGELKGMGIDDIAVAIDKMCGEFQMEEYLPKRIEVLSKGYRCRLGLMSASIHSPSVLILDEPSDGLDPNQMRRTREFIKQMSAGKMTLISTHRLDELEHLCTRVILLHKGKIILDEDISSFLDRAKGRDMDEVFFGLTNR